MINDKEGLYKRIRDYKLLEDSSDYERKVDCLEASVNDSIARTCEDILRTDSRINLAFSGGVDSSVLLKTMLDQGIPVTAHTIASRKDSPDIEHANQYAAELQKEHPELQHTCHIILLTDEDLLESNRILNENNTRPDNYHTLMKIAAQAGIKNIVGGDCIDEMLAGYYAHQNPVKLPTYDPGKSIRENRIATFNYFMARLISNHLDIADRFSTHFGIKMFLPYGDKTVMESAQRFDIDELVDDTERKKPMYDLARRKGIMPSIIERRKYGLVNALD